MNKSLLTFCAILTSMGLFSQSDFTMTDYLTKDSVKVKLGMYTEGMYNSNVMNNSVFYNSVFKNGISRNSFLNMEARALKRNVAGIYQSERIFTSWKGKATDSLSFTHFFTIGTSRLINANFSGDLFKLAGLGNKKLAGQKADASRLDLNLMQYTRLQYGRIYQKGDLTFGGGVSFIIGNKYVTAQTKDAWLYTSDIGDSISVRINGSTLESDTSSKLIYDPNGLGAGVDLFFSMPFDLSKKNRYTGTMSVEVNDLGFISWNKETLSRVYDGRFDWPGISAPSLFEITDSIYQNQFPDTLENEFLKEASKSNNNMLLPMRIAINYYERINEKVDLRVMLDYRLNSNYLPYVALTQRVKLNDKPGKLNYYVNIFESLGGYGFGGLGCGMEVEHRNFGINLGVRHVLALAVPETLSGVNMRFGFHWNFY